MKYIILITIMLSGCIHTNKFDIQSNFNPDINQPIILKLEVCKWDIPRNTQEYIVKNTTKCKVLEKDQNMDTEWFKTNCLEHPVDIKSNLMIGFDEKNYLCYVKNMETIRYTLKSYNEKIKLYNSSK